MSAAAAVPGMSAPAGAPGRVAVKICGVADLDSAVLSAELGADLLGLNFWSGSPRRVDLGLARELAAAARAAAPRLLLVGVFVNPTAAEVEAAAAAAGLDLLQFSGDEPPGAVRPFAARAIKVLRLGRSPQPAALAGLAAGFEDCWGLLFDSPATGAAPARAAAAGRHGTDYGGTGRAWDYDAVRSLLSGPGEGCRGASDPAAATATGGASGAPASAAGPQAAGAPGAPAGPGSGGAAERRRRVLLAGGIGPANVRQVVARLRPFAVDVCSAVESAPGTKDPRLLAQLFEEVRNGQATSAT